MKKIHETQSSESYKNVEEDKLYTPIEDYQRIEAGGVYKKNHIKLSTLPKGIRYIGYVLIGFTVITTIIGIIMTIFF
ncbi:hypothetical protein [Neobacillus sp. D3-1R]|uniref:hypothetical protein n=1 Tax=Neobacillus sp. D3-1R TaxID=3445778 RepID=UPI003FA05B9F